MAGGKAVYWLETQGKKRRAVVIAHSYESASLRVRREDPTGGWEVATIFMLTPCRSSMTSRVVALERKTDGN